MCLCVWCVCFWNRPYSYDDRASLHHFPCVTGRVAGLMSRAWALVQVYSVRNHAYSLRIFDHWEPLFFFFSMIHHTPYTQKNYLLFISFFEKYSMAYSRAFKKETRVIQTMQVNTIDSVGWHSFSWWLIYSRKFTIVKGRKCLSVNFFFLYFNGIIYYFYTLATTCTSGSLTYNSFLSIFWHLFFDDMCRCKWDDKWFIFKWNICILTRQTLFCPSFLQ